MSSHDPAFEDDDWHEDAEELPRRPRRRLLRPLPVTLFAVLAIACGFIAGVLVEKGQASSGGASSAASSGSLASRFAALRGNGTGAGAATGGGGFAGAGAGGGAGASAGAAAPTSGQVAFIHGNTLYVTDTQGNTVKVTTSAASTVTKTVKASVSGIHPGETIVVTGATGADGTVSAESIRVGAAGGSALGSLFGSSRGGSSSGSGSSSSSGGGPALFGPGG
jgi:hypothetical protein